MPPKKKAAKPAKDGGMRGKFVEATEKLSPQERADFVLRYIEGMNPNTRIRRASDVWQPYHIRRPTGITSLDIRTGGGWAAGTINQIFGKDATGKNLVVDHTIAQIQEHYGEDAGICIASFGQPYQKDFGKKNGVKVGYAPAEVEAMRRMLAADGDELTPDMEAWLREEAGLFALIGLTDSDAAFAAPAESTLTTLIEAIKTGMFQLVVLDETNVGESKYAAEAELGADEKVASFATLMTRFVKKFWNAIMYDLSGNPNQTTVIEILEARVKIGGFSPTGEALEQGGGMALRHAKSVDLHMLGGAPLRIPEVDESIGKEMKWRVSKGKVGCHEGGSGMFRFNYIPLPDGSPYGIDLTGDLIDESTRRGILTRSGAWYSWGDERIGCGLTAASAWLRANPDRYATLRTSCLKMAGVSRTYRDDPE